MRDPRPLQFSSYNFLLCFYQYRLEMYKLTLGFLMIVFLQNILFVFCKNSCKIMHAKCNTLSPFCEKLLEMGPKSIQCPKKIVKFCKIFSGNIAH